MATHDQHGHRHGPVHLDAAHWQAFAAQTELEGELLLGFATDAAEWVNDRRGPHAPSVRRVLDIGSGPGVGTCELARLFPDAQVIAVDGSPAMLEEDDLHTLDVWATPTAPAVSCIGPTCSWRRGARSSSPARGENLEERVTRAARSPWGASRKRA